MHVEVPRTKFFLRGKAGVEAIWGLPSQIKEPNDVKAHADETFGTPLADLMEFSSDGSKVVLVNGQRGFTVRDTES
jgi:translation initiation factor 2A